MARPWPAVYPSDAAFRHAGRSPATIRQYLEPEAMTWVQDRTNGQRLAMKRVAKAGWYGMLYRDYMRGITCPWGYNPE